VHAYSSVFPHPFGLECKTNDLRFKRQSLIIFQNSDEQLYARYIQLNNYMLDIFSWTIICSIYSDEQLYARYIQLRNCSSYGLFSFLFWWQQKRPYELMLCSYRGWGWKREPYRQIISNSIQDHFTNKKGARYLDARIWENLPSSYVFRLWERRLYQQNKGSTWQVG
jgi:hypothetical protein